MFANLELDPGDRGEKCQYQCVSAGKGFPAHPSEHRDYGEHQHSGNQSPEQTDSRKSDPKKRNEQQQTRGCT